MPGVDIVLSTTGSPDLVIHARDVQGVMHRREGRALVLVDIAVPRDIDPEVDELHNVFRFDLEALNGVVEKSVSQRRKAVPTVEELVDGEVEGFMRWWRGLGSGSVIRDLHHAFEAVRAQELERNAKRFQDADREPLDVWSRNLINKLLMTATRELKAYRADDPAHAERLAVLREVFHLDERGEEENGDDFA
jgi:glutamyl-tRNA reductase